jgi:hypothetical protein
VLKGPPASTPTAAYTAHDVTRGGAADEEAFGVGLGVSDAVGDALVVHGDAEALKVGLGDDELDADRLPVVVVETLADALVAAVVLDESVADADTLSEPVADADEVGESKPIRVVEQLTEALAEEVALAVRVSETPAARQQTVLAR